MNQSSVGSHVLQFSNQITLKDGETVVLLGDTEEEFAGLLYERLGLEAEGVFRCILEETKAECEAYYTDGDGAYQQDEETRDVMLNARDAAEEAYKAIDRMLSDRISRIQLQGISKQLKALCKEIDSQL